MTRNKGMIEKIKPRWVNVADIAERRALPDPLLLQTIEGKRTFTATTEGKLEGRKIYGGFIAAPDGIGFRSVWLYPEQVEKRT